MKFPDGSLGSMICRCTVKMVTPSMNFLVRDGGSAVSSRKWVILQIKFRIRQNQNKLLEQLIFVHPANGTGGKTLLRDRFMYYRMIDGIEYVSLMVLLELSFLFNILFVVALT